jgi:hypothetical protein
MGKALPYENATSGSKAMGEIQSLLAKFGCQSFGHMTDYERKLLIVQFKYRDMPICVEASAAGYAAAWLKEHPYSNKVRCTRQQHEQKALDKANTAIYSILRDWIKGQVTAIECGILSFEGAFLGQILLPSGSTILQHVVQSKTLQIEAPNGR